MKKSMILFLAFVLILPLLAASCVTKQVPVVETYSETEYKTEYRTESTTETVNTVISSNEGTTYLTPQVKWYTDVLVAGAEGEGGTYYYDYVIMPSHSRNQVQISLSPNVKYENGEVRVYNLSGAGPIPPRPTPYKKFFYQATEIDWLNSLNTVLSTAPLLGQVQLGPDAATQITFDGSGVTEFGIFATTWNAYAVRSVKLVWTDEVLGTKTVTGEKQVPYQVPYQVEKQRTVYKTESVPFWEAISGK
jgi:hypothetical protein